MKTLKDMEYSIEHTKQRLKERYNLVITDLEYYVLCHRVNNKINVEFISEEKQSNGLQQIYDIEYKGAKIRVVWSRSDQYIKTILPI
jgi:hypothetical protein